MRTFRPARLAGSLSCLVLLAALTAGCGEQDAGPAETPTSSATPASPDTPTDDIPTDDDPTDDGTDDPDAATTPTSIEMTRTGGIAGVLDRWRIAPGDEFTGPAFELASRREALEQEVATLDAETPCCDFFVYDVLVRYEDGTSVRAVVAEPDAQTPVLAELVTAVADSERLQPDEQKL